MSADQQQQQQQQRRGSNCFLGVGREWNDDELSIIDVSEFDDTAQDRWLYSLGNRSRRSSMEGGKLEDLMVWLHADVVESEAAQLDNNSRRSIDTRTFTRIKRRSNRLNFDGMEGGISPETSPFSLSNIWKNNTIQESNEHMFNNNNIDKDQSIQNDKRDSIPMMLRPKTNQVLAAILSESPSSISSQTSMEAFMNIARKEGSNFLLSDVSDLDFNSGLMNISQPSLLYSSIISDGKSDDNVQQTVFNIIENGMIDSQILTESMMEASMFKEVQDTTVLAQFLKQNNDITVIEDTTFDLNERTFVDENLTDRTYINKNDNESESCNATFVADKNLKPNETFVTHSSPVHKVKSANSTKMISPVLNTTCTFVTTPTSLNSTRVLSSEAEPLQNDILSTTQTLNSEHKTDVTFEVKSPTSVEERLDATYQTSGGQLPRLSGSSGGSTPPLDATFNMIPPLRAELLKEVQRSSGGKLNGTFTNSPKKLDITYDRPSSAEPLLEVESLDATYVYVPSKHRSESPTNKPSLDTTYDTMTLTSKLCNQTNATGPKRMSYAPNRNLVEMQSHLSDPNRFNTFRKDSKIGSRLSKVPQVQENHAPSLPPPQAHVPNTKSVDNSYQQRYKTFSKKTNVAKNCTSPKPTIDIKAEEKKFVKPQIRQIQPPRTLSKLPQLFQKSNPNLGSNIKPPRNSRLSMDVGFKGSQPNINSNIQALGRFKSERLLPRKTSTEFSTSDGTSQSMESIDSNASAHSAPDLDDRRSVASDSSRASYIIKPRNLNVMNKLGSMEERIGVFNGSTPKVKVLENNWVREKDLPSPILKNGISKNHVECDSRSSSPSDSTEFSAKTSSPLTNSPSNSDHTINTISDSGIEAAKENNQAIENVKPKQQIKAPSITTKGTMLKRPSNWTGASNKAANGSASGIPRPASRIPAPRFAKPNPK